MGRGSDFNTFFEAKKKRKKGKEKEIKRERKREKGELGNKNVPTLALIFWEAFQIGLGRISSSKELYIRPW